MSVPVKVLEHRADVEAVKLADLLVEFVSGGLLFAPDTVRPVLAARLRRELSAASVKRLAKILGEQRPWEEIVGPGVLRASRADVEVEAAPLGVPIATVWPGR